MPDAVGNLPDAQKDTKSKSKTKRYLLVVFAVVIALASIFLVFQFLPSITSAPVPEEGIYVVGEKMKYHRTVTYEVENNTNSIESTSVIEVLSFDGENYNLDQTTWIEGQELSISMKANLKGEIFQLQGYPVDPYDSTSLFPVYGDNVRFNNENPGVDDTWSVPFALDLENSTVRGTIHYTFSETATVTVPAGTYDVIKIEAEISDFESSGLVGTQQMSSTQTFTGYILLEESTHNVIEYQKVNFASIILGSQTTDGITTTFYQLVEHTR